MELKLSNKYMPVIFMSYPRESKRRYIPDNTGRDVKFNKIRRKVIEFHKQRIVKVRSNPFMRNANTRREFQSMFIKGKV